MTEILDKLVIINRDDLTIKAIDLEMLIKLSLLIESQNREYFIVEL